MSQEPERIHGEEQGSDDSWVSQLEGVPEKHEPSTPPSNLPTATTTNRLGKLENPAKTSAATLYFLPIKKLGRGLRCGGYKLGKKRQTDSILL